MNTLADALMKMEQNNALNVARILLDQQSYIALQIVLVSKSYHRTVKVEPCSSIGMLKELVKSQDIDGIYFKEQDKVYTIKETPLLKDYQWLDQVIRKDRKYYSKFKDLTVKQIADKVKEMSVEERDRVMMGGKKEYVGHTFTTWSWGFFRDLIKEYWNGTKRVLECYTWVRFKS